MSTFDLAALDAMLGTGDEQASVVDHKQIRMSMRTAITGFVLTIFCVATYALWGRDWPLDYRKLLAFLTGLSGATSLFGLYFGISGLVNYHIKTRAEALRLQTEALEATSETHALLSMCEKAMTLDPKVGDVLARVADTQMDEERRSHPEIFRQVFKTGRNRT